MMNRTVVNVLLLLLIFIVALWYLTFHFRIVPAHARDPLGSQNTTL